ncbi:carbon starvation CstA family protein [uncultured Prevotella sp.]|uniref:carbon starvation CstA family protein n=1 Tax=uncultured Prevotella sp. TaxID=159272 RepID=UPI002582F9AB|nr:carbon starvation CstA family protein [uncultured Prevotella sp.]
MITFVLSLAALVLGYFLYGRFVERVFGPDDRPTPAIAKADGVDFMVLPSWKIFMIQFLNIAGTGPIFGAIMGAKFGPAAYLWIVFGCIFAGATHDYLSGMLSIRNGGANLPEIIGKYLGNVTKQVMLIFSVFLLMMVGAVFVFSPAKILGDMWEPVFFTDNFGPYIFWISIVFIYYIVATMMPIDKIIGRVYPLFAFSLLFMAGALMVMLFVKRPDIPEVWEGVSGDLLTKKNIFPCLFITIACGAISGFHATQTPLMARCVKSEKMGRPMFYGAMITEGIVALIWATVAMYFFYDQPTPGYQLMEDGVKVVGDAPSIVNLICNDWLGVVGGILALLGVVAAPITSGDTALRSARLIIAEFLKMEQRSIRKRLYICIPMFLVTMAILIWQIADDQTSQLMKAQGVENYVSGFEKLWGWFGWSNQTLSVFTLWAITVYFVRQKKNFFITLVPALFMTVVCATFFFSEKVFTLSEQWTWGIAGGAFMISLIWFLIWYLKTNRNL